MDVSGKENALQGRNALKETRRRRHTCKIFWLKAVWDLSSLLVNGEEGKMVMMVISSVTGM